MQQMQLGGAEAGYQNQADRDGYVGGGDAPCCDPPCGLHGPILFRIGVHFQALHLGGDPGIYRNLFFSCLLYLRQDLCGQHSFWWNHLYSPRMGQRLLNLEVS